MEIWVTEEEGDICLEQPPGPPERFFKIVCPRRIVIDLEQCAGLAYIYEVLERLGYTKEKK